MASQNPDDKPIPANCRLVEEEQLSFLWFQAAGAALLCLGAGRMPVLSDAERLDCVARLGKIFQQHADVLPEEAVMVMDCLVAAAVNLTELSGH